MDVIGIPVATYLLDCTRRFLMTRTSTLLSLAIICVSMASCAEDTTDQGIGSGAQKQTYACQEGNNWCDLSISGDVYFFDGTTSSAGHNGSVSLEISFVTKRTMPDLSERLETARVVGDSQVTISGKHTIDLAYHESLQTWTW